MLRISSKDMPARWGLLISIFILAIVLIIASWANYNSARNAVRMIYQGQAGYLGGAVREVLRKHDASGVKVAMERVLEERYADGMRFIGLVNERGEILQSAGEPDDVLLTNFQRISPREPFTLIKLESRVRIVFFRPHRSGKPGDYQQRNNSGKTHNRPRGPGPGPGGETSLPGNLIFEFEPLIASDLLDRATRLRAFGLVAAVVMLLVAIILWRMSRRYEQTMLRLEHERRLSLLGEMSAVMAHEIRNPLASLKGHAQLLAERLTSESSERRKADRVVFEAGRLEALTSDLLDFVKTGSPNLSELNPGELIRAAIKDVDENAFELDVENAPENWLLDEQRLHQALTNLLRNALQATPEGAGQPRVQVMSERNELTITIRDFGEGISEAEKDRIFDPFFTTRTTGTGLGLSVARRLIELHGGRITAENHSDGGALFRIALPAGRS